MSDAQLAYVEERRSTRIDRAIPLLVHGADLSRAPYDEQVSTLTISYHGCKYRTRHQLLRGDIVLLEVNQPHDPSSVTSTRARVKWLHPLTNGDERAFEVAVELEAPGNIWGVDSPPHDWSIVSRSNGSALDGSEAAAMPLADESASAMLGFSQALQVMPRPQTQMASFAQVIAGLGEQIQIMASDAATNVMVEEKNRLLSEFRAELQHEAASTIESVIAASKEQMAQRVWKELSEAHEAAAHAIYHRWLAKIEDDSESASLRIASRGSEVSERVENMAVATIERLQHNMDASRREAVDQCLSRLRSQLLPLLEEVQTARERLAASEDELKVKSLIICKQFEDFMVQESERCGAATQEAVSALAERFDEKVQERLTAAQGELDKKSAATVDESTAALLELSQDCQHNARNQLDSLVQSASNQLSGEMKQRTEQISRECSAELEGYTRSHLDFISESIAEIAKKRATRHD